MCISVSWSDVLSLSSCSDRVLERERERTKRGDECINRYVVLVVYWSCLSCFREHTKLSSKVIQIQMYNIHVCVDYRSMYISILHGVSTKRSRKTATIMHTNLVTPRYIELRCGGESLGTLLLVRFTLTMPPWLTGAWIALLLLLMPPPLLFLLAVLFSFCCDNFAIDSV